MYSQSNIQPHSWSSSTGFAHPFPSHVTHSWQTYGGPDPIAQVAHAITRLAVAIEKLSEQGAIKETGG